MRLHARFPERGDGLHCHHLVPQARQPRRIGACAGTDVEHGACPAWQQVADHFVFISGDHAGIPGDQLSGIVGISFGARDWGCMHAMASVQWDGGQINTLRAARAIGGVACVGQL